MYLRVGELMCNLFYRVDCLPSAMVNWSHHESSQGRMATQASRNAIGDKLVDVMKKCVMESLYGRFIEEHVDKTSKPMTVLWRGDLHVLYWYKKEADKILLSCE